MSKVRFSLLTSLIGLLSIIGIILSGLPAQSEQHSKNSEWTAEWAYQFLKRTPLSCPSRAPLEVDPHAKENLAAIDKYRNQRGLVPAGTRIIIKDRRITTTSNTGDYYVTERCATQSYHYYGAAAKSSAGKLITSAFHSARYSGIPLASPYIFQLSPKLGLAEWLMSAQMNSIDSCPTDGSICIGMMGIAKSI
ncbi:MAG TPA: hypothetical protein V6C52_02990 [Coleofasciculaceae cyanobacterium]|jgi:hypothetical protein